MSSGKGEQILRATPGRSTPLELSAVDESGYPVLPRIPTAFWIVDRDLRITTAYGPGFDSLSLHPELETVVGLDLFEYFKTDDPEFESIANHLIALSGKPVDCESKLRGRAAEVRLEPLRRHGEVVGVIGFALDVTDHRVLEEQLERAQQVDSMGALAGGIAHDFNNVLTAISGFAHLALSEVEPGSAAEAHLRQVTQASELGAAMTSRLLSFSRCEQPAPRQLNVDAVVLDVELLLRGMIGTRVRLVMDLDGALPTICADPDQLRRLLVNLAVNARDAMPTGGVLTIETVTQPVKAPSRSTSATPVPAWPRRCARGCSSRSSPPSPWARGPGWVWPRSRGSSRSAAAGSRSIPSPGWARPLDRPAHGPSRLRGRLLDRLDQVAELTLGIEVRKPARAVGTEAVAMLDALVARLRHPLDRLVERAHLVAQVMETFSAPLQPLSQNVLALERLQQLELRIRPVQCQPHRELGRLAANVQPVHVPRAVLDNQPLR